MRYEIYKKTASGGRGTIIEGYVKFNAVLRFNEVGKWQLTGSSNDFCPLNENDGIIVYRNGVPFISGYVTDIAEEVDETYESGQVINWTVDGLDDNGLLSRRVIIPDPVHLDLTTEAHQTIRDYGGNAILEYIHTQAGLGAKSGRKVPNLTVDTDKNLGMIQTYNARLQNLWEFVVEISQGQALGIRVIWDGEQGSYTATVYTPTDKSDLIIFSREFGNLKKWNRKRSAPTANAIWVAGQGEKTERMFSYREDAASIAKWGRFEAVKDRRDLSNEQDENDPRTPQQILDDTAEELIEANKATEGYELELAPIERMSYRDDWELGDIVKIRVGTTEFQAIIEEVKIDYAGGIETVTPSVGTINRGAISKTYSTIQTISDRVAVLERNEGKSMAGLVDLFNTHVHNGTDAPKVDVYNLNNIPGQIPNKPVLIPNNTNLNNLLDPGFYYCPLNDIAGSLLNCPTDRAFGMTITRTSGINQEIKPFFYGDEFRVSRNYYGGVWGTWKKYLPNEDTGWINLPMLNGWKQHGSFPVIKYRRVNKMVFYDGLINGTAKTSNHFSTLPTGCRPSNRQYGLSMPSDIPSGAIKVDVDGTMLFIGIPATVTYIWIYGIVLVD